MFDIGVPELLLILIIGLIFFGPGKLPELGKAIGKSIKEFKNASSENESSASKEKPFTEEKIIDVKEEQKK
ncbi:twin-arginine translocase TatA/TatE family subunit [Pectinatus sottacetonis]|uniref:twin-arginine translocase TatA/TatE family subunit n=1 Tax=Pectinatus sottacetonis TaxID=1002795 RepID=UPI0018C61C42|nr:twin-arginine translocase TatA/TatE family subunit [Pectinatus sottacetonis]